MACCRRLPYADSVAPDQVAHPRSLIWSYTVRIWQTTIDVSSKARVKEALPNFTTFSCSLTTLRYFNYLALLTKNCLKKMRKKSSISEKFTIKNAILVLALQSKKGTTTTTSTSWTVLVLNRLFSCTHGVHKVHCGIETYVTRHSKMVLRTYEISMRSLI